MATWCAASLASAQMPSFPPFDGRLPPAPGPSFPGQSSPAFSGGTTPVMGAPGNNAGAPTAGGAEPQPFFERGKLVAQVGDQPIFYGEILGDLNQIVDREMPDASETLKDARRRELFEMMLPKLVEQKMVYVDFERNLPDLDKRLPEIMDRLEKSFYESEIPKLMKRTGVEDPRQLEARMIEAGTSMRNIKRAWKENQIVGFYLSEKFKEEREVTHEDMVEYYRSHLDKYSFPARVRWEELMVRLDAFPTPEEARRAIESMGNEVVFGAPFDAVARRSSQGSTAAAGGRYDWTNQGSIKDADLDRQLFTIPLGYLSDVVVGPDGFRIVRVLEREPGGHKAFRDVQREIKEAIQKERRQAQINEYLDKLKRDVPVWTIMDGEPQPMGSPGSSSETSPSVGSGARSPLR